MRRGDLVTIVLPGAYGKPRPALVLQDDGFLLLPSVTVAPLTTMLKPTPLFRVTIEPEPHTGLKQSSQVMVDKIVTAPRSRIGSRIGTLDHPTLEAVGSAVSRFLGLPLTP